MWVADPGVEAATIAVVWGTGTTWFLRSSNLKTGPAPALEESGFAVFAFGKLGGKELNYSSDIDLLALFDSSLYFQRLVFCFP